MTLLLATATRTDPTLGYLILAAAALAWAAGYLIACAVWPFRTCRRCDGSGKRRSPSGKAFRLCRRCKGTARQLRLGRRVWNYARRLRSETGQ